VTLSPQWDVHARTPGLVEDEPVVGYSAIAFDAPLLEVGTWSISLPVGHPALAAMASAGGGIVIRPPGVPDPVFSGFTTQVEVVATYTDRSAQQSVQVSGVTDDIVLAGARAYPDPTTDISTTSVVTPSAAYDVRTGSGEDVILGYIADNIGPSAGIARRRLSWLTIPASAGRGSAVTGRARGDDLLALAATLRAAASSPVAVRVLQAGPGQLAVLPGTDRPDVRVSPTVGTLDELRATIAAPVAQTAVIESKSDTNAVLVTRRVGPGAMWMPPREAWLQGSGQALADLRQDADSELADQASTSSATIVGRDVPGQRWGIDYQLGDRIRVGLPRPAADALGYVEIADVVTRVRGSGGPGQAPTLTVSVGATATDETASDRQLVRLAQQLVKTARR
jgi:hypothetical protein